MVRSSKLVVFVAGIGSAAVASAGSSVTNTSSPNAQVLPDNGCVDDATGTGLGGISDTIVFTESGTITDINIGLEMTQTWRSDIQVGLSYSGGGGTVILVNNFDTSGDNLNLLADSEAGALCSAAANCGTGTNCVTPPGPTCQPNQSLTAFNGLTLPGTFTLTVCDRAAGDLGNLVSWSVTAEGVAVDADLAITKTDGVTTVNPGGSTTYTIVASNAGPAAAPGSTVVDTFPADLTCTWTCVGAGGGTCTAAGAGNINDVVNLPSGGSTTYTASCTISGAATGTLANTATVTAPGGVNDPNLANNSATDTDTVAPPGNLTISPTSIDFGDIAVGTPSGSQSVTLGNNGGSPLQVTALTAASAPFALAGGTCGPAPFAIPAAASCTLDYQFSPAATGPAAQVLTVTANTTGSGNISLAGNGVVGVVGLLSATLDFGTVVIGASPQQTLTILNSGDGALQVTDISAVAAPFAQVAGGTCAATPFAIAPSGSCTVFYSFTPVAPGPVSQPVVVTADVGSATATLLGNGALGSAETRELPSLSQLAVALLTLLMLAIGVTAAPFRRKG